MSADEVAGAVVSSLVNVYGVEASARWLRKFAPSLFSSNGDYGLRRILERDGELQTERKKRRKRVPGGET